MMSGKHFKAQEVSCCIKYFIFGFNIIFWFLGVTFLGIGLWAWSEKGVLSNISSITDLGGFDPVWLFLVVGGVMFILGFAGCIGALRENSFLLKFFSVFLGIIFFLELTAGVLAFVFKDWIKDQLKFFINNNIRAYRDDIDLQNLIDFTQEYWECCGAFGADDWNLNIYFNCTDSNPSREKCGVPFSCCTKDPAVGLLVHSQYGQNELFLRVCNLFNSLRGCWETLPGDTAALSALSRKPHVNVKCHGCRPTGHPGVSRPRFCCQRSRVRADGWRP
ncbi:transcript variant X1 [Nothobranchius furzeri]|uniref:Tetraspanin 5 n=1 Tax=Nothobranchius furzeri TaxID=105023 RepID=A0A8C6KBM3_NOTFU|nr:tetraspanin-5 isoform X1 [Nothobranchius furzeri]KAF7217908.1 transcript variant X1 [Nothobranchius furzeri]